MTLSTIGLIFVAGILPALLWLFFWLREDRLHPEPKKTLAISFTFGMFMVPVAYFVQKGFISFVAYGPMLVIIWAGAEELLKLFASLLSTTIGKRYYDEPIDALIYMITVALGFSALENCLFLFSEILDKGILDGLITSNLRFIGSSLLHILTSGTVGAFLAFAFYKSRAKKILYAIIGIIIASTLHAEFNILLMKEKYLEKSFYIFSAVWVAIILLLVTFEKIKKFPLKPKT